MRKILFIVVCCLCLVGCENNNDSDKDEVQNQKLSTIERNCCTDNGGRIVDEQCQLPDSSGTTNKYYNECIAQ